MGWLRKSPTASSSITPRGHHVGLDVTSSRLAAVSLGHGRSRSIVLDEPSTVLPLVVNAEGRSAIIGRSGLGLVRRRPHLAFDNFLAALGQTKPWRGGRHTLTPEDALRLAFGTIRPILHSESDALVFTLPAYLKAAQIERIIDAAHRADLPLEGTIAMPLALVADRAAMILGSPHVEEEPDEPVVMPIHAAKPGPGCVLVIDADAHGLNGSIVAVDSDRVYALGSTSWPRTNVKVWFSRLIDAIADRCVRLCRRDPRDSADAEQDLFDQLHAALDNGLPTHRVNLTLRTAQWYQVMVQRPEDFEEDCADLARLAVEDVQELIASASLSGLPKMIWLTHDAGRLPGLAKALHANSAVHTSLEVLPPQATALAAARLVPRWLRGEIARTHIDSELKLPAKEADTGPKPQDPANNRNTRSAQSRK